MSTPSIRRVSYLEILRAPNALQLIAEYAAECSIPEIGKISAQAESYAQLEAAGVLTCFGAFAECEPGDLPGSSIPGDFFLQLVGFASVLTVFAPHYGRKVATVESLFVSRAHRPGRTGYALMSAIESYAETEGCPAILYSAPAYSRFAKVLAGSHSYKCTNVVYCRPLRPSDVDLSPGNPVLA